YRGSSGPGGAGSRGRNARRGTRGPGPAAGAVGGPARAPLLGTLVRRNRRGAGCPRIERRHVAATRGRSFPKGAGMNDQKDIERALSVDDAPVDTENALTRFRARVAREGVLPVSATPRRRIAARWLQTLAAA